MMRNLTSGLLAIAVLSICTVSGQPTDADVDFTETSTGGHLVVVPKAVLPQAGFMAIHDSTLLSKQDPFGSVLGVTAAMPAGTHWNVTVELGPANGNNKAFTMNATDTLIAMPHKDSNNNGIYDFITSKGADDGPFAGGPHATQTFVGNIVLASANVTRSSMLVVKDQTTDGRTYSIAMLDLSVAGFVALHDSTLLSAQDPFGSVVAISPAMPAGLSKNVRLTFGKDIDGGSHTGPLATSQLLIAMPHKDSNMNGKYDFITSKGADDGPFAGSAQTFVGNINIETAMATVTAQSSGTSTSALPGSSTTATIPSSSQPASTSDSSKGSPAVGMAVVLFALGALLLVAYRR